MLSISVCRGGAGSAATAAGNDDAALGARVDIDVRGAPPGLRQQFHRRRQFLDERARQEGTLLCQYDHFAACGTLCEFRRVFFRRVVADNFVAVQLLRRTRSAKRILIIIHHGDFHVRPFEKFINKIR
jgi:hypothetical protein